jgi:hypothetical protein
MNLTYRAAGNRCAVHIPSLNLPFGTRRTLNILRRDGFNVLDINIVDQALGRIKKSTYHRGALPSQAPKIIDCSSFVKWLYAQCGIWIPRRSIQQRDFGTPVMARTDIVAGDLIFVSGFIDWYHNDPQDGVGHVGIATGYGTVIHAADSETGVIESAYNTFVGISKLRGIRRYIPADADVLTLECPRHRPVETSDDLRWIILQQTRW